MIRFTPALLLLLTGCAGPDAATGGMAASTEQADTLSITAANDGDGCLLMVGGRRLTSEQFTEIARTWPNRRVSLNIAPQTQYRCVGGALFTLQRYGFEGEVIDAESRRRVPFVSPG